MADGGGGGGGGGVGGAGVLDVRLLYFSRWRSPSRLMLQQFYMYALHRSALLHCPLLHHRPCVAPHTLSPLTTFLLVGSSVAVLARPTQARGKSPAAVPGIYAGCSLPTYLPTYETTPYSLTATPSHNFLSAPSSAPASFAPGIMDDDEQRRTSRASPILPSSSSSSLHNAHTDRVLKGHVSQPHSPPRSSSFETLPTHPFNLTLPTLNDDGSVPDLTAQPYRRHISPTPPAALSSLGARLRMDRSQKKYDSESEGSLTDNQYDMLDDLSEISDGHDTASIASNGEDGQRTPEDSQSEADLEHSTMLLDETSQTGPWSACQSFVDIDGSLEAIGQSRPSAEIRAENELIDSCWPDDLETPRQSTIASTLRSPPMHDSFATTISREVRRILFISEQNKALRSIMDHVCANVAACLDNALDELSTYKVMRLPATPSGITLPSATVVHGQGSVAATVQHCIGADIRAAKSYKLRILDNDGETSSFFTVGEDAKIDLVKPDVAVYYIAPDQQHPGWLKAAQKAVQALNVPALFILNTDDAKIRSKWARRHVLSIRQKKQKTFSLREVSNLSRDVAEDIIDIVSARREAPSNVPGGKRFSVRKLARFLLGMLLLVAQVYFRAYFKADPALEFTARREALTAALTTLTNSSEAPQSFEIERLLPDPLTACKAGSPCDRDFRSQLLLPNHIIFSLPSRPQVPKIEGMRVYNADGLDLPFNDTTLVNGVHGITIDRDSAFGQIFLSVATKVTRPGVSNNTVSYQFGHRMLNLRTYEKASSDVGKEVSKEVTLLKQKARSLSEKLPLTIGAGIFATKNVTSQLVSYVAQDLQVLGSTALSIINKAAQVGNETATIFTKDVVVMQKDLVKFTKDVSTKAKSSVESFKTYSRAIIRNPLEKSRERAQALSKALGLGQPSDKKADRQQRHKGRETKKALSVTDEPTAKGEPDFRTIQSDWAETKKEVESLRKRAKDTKCAKKESKKAEKKLRKEAKKPEKNLRKMRAEIPT